MAAGDVASAAQHFEEASYDAYYFTDPLHMPDLGLMEEAFRYGALNHILASGKGVFPPLTAAAGWAKANHFRQLYVSLLTLAAEDNIILGQTQKAAALLDEARGAMGNRAIALSRLAARRAFLQATALYQEHQERKTQDGDAVVAKLMTFLRNSSIRLFQIQRVDDYYTSGGKGGINAAREAVDLYKEVLRDPQPIDWMTDPMESLAVLSVPHELLVRALVQGRGHPARTTNWRWKCPTAPAAPLLLHAPAGRPAGVAPLGAGGAPRSCCRNRPCSSGRTCWSAIRSTRTCTTRPRPCGGTWPPCPLPPATPRPPRSRRTPWSDWPEVGRKQELVLREIALRREPAVLAFPPLRTTAEIQKSLPPGHALLVFFATNENIHAFLLNRDKYADWQIAGTPQAIALKTNDAAPQAGQRRAKLRA